MTQFLDALQCKNESRAPVWLMRQAGRYLPEYRKIRGKYSFLEMCHQPEVAAEVTLLPIKRFEMDAAILFSDILVIPEALGLGLHFREGEGPTFERPILEKKDIESLPQIEAKELLGYVAQTIQWLKPSLKVPLIGFCGAPFTVASYMIEGKSSPDLKKTKQWMYRDPESFHQLLDKIADCSIDYLQMQIDAGVDAIQIFDSWANTLGHHQFLEFSLSYMRKIQKGIGQIPVIVFCRGSSVFARELAELEVQGVSLDWNVDLPYLRKIVSKNVALQGNLDPDILYAPLEVIQKEVGRLLYQMKNDKGYIFNLGHGIKPDMQPDAVKALVDTVKNFHS